MRLMIFVSLVIAMVTIGQAFATQIPDILKYETSINAVRDCVTVVLVPVDMFSYYEKYQCSGFGNVGIAYEVHGTREGMKTWLAPSVGESKAAPLALDGQVDGKFPMVEGDILYWQSALKDGVATPFALIYGVTSERNDHHLMVARLSPAGSCNIGRIEFEGQGDEALPAALVKARAFADSKARDPKTNCL